MLFVIRSLGPVPRVHEFAGKKRWPSKTNKFKDLSSAKCAIVVYSIT